MRGKRGEREGQREESGIKCSKLLVMLGRVTLLFL